MLPYINEVPKSRSYVNEFRGYNHNEGISEKEMYDGYNLTADEYPVLSTRKPRGDVDAPMPYILGMNGALGLAYVYLSTGSQVVFQYNNLCYQGTLDNNDTSLRQIVPFGSKLIIFPDCKVFDTIKCEFSNALFEKDIEQYEISYFINHGTAENPNIEVIELGEEYKFVTVGEGDPGIYKKDGESPISNAGVRIEIPNKLLSLPGAELSIDGYKTVGDRLGFLLGSKLLGFNEYLSNYKIEDGYYMEGRYITNSAKNQYGAFAPVNRLRVCGDGSISCQKESGDAFEVEDEYFGDSLTLTVSSIKPPLMDFVVECQNRLWGCRKGTNHDGEEVNEIYATRLGTYNDWYSFEGLADSSYTASVATSGNFTGAITLSNNPIFFKENVAHKVYVSASGAHQVYTLDVRGVQKDSAGSIAVVNENVIYKGVRDVLLFDGTNVTPISDALGDVRYSKAVAGADGDKYVMYCEENVPGATPKRYIFAFDTKKGIWHRELIDHSVMAMTVYDHKLYIGTTAGIIVHEASATDERERNIKYMLESGVIGYESPDAKTLCRIDFRVKLALGTTFTVWIQYDSDGSWIEATRHRGMTAIPRCESVYVLPRRCDHFKYKITGTGDMKLYSVSRIYERSSE